MIIKTPAIVLRYAPTGNTSRVVTWLTPIDGRVSTILKGALRPKSLFLGQYDMFYTCELLYYRRREQSVYVASACAPIKLRAALRHDWRACALASYWVDLAARISPATAPQGFLYDWLDRALDHLAEQSTHPGEVVWFELQLLREMGLAPRLRHCVACNKRLQASEGATFFSQARGGLLCASCARGQSESLAPVAPDILAMLQHWQQVDRPETIRRTRSRPAQEAAMNRVMGDFLRFHLDLPLPSRDLALSIYNRPVKMIA